MSNHTFSLRSKLLRHSANSIFCATLAACIIRNARCTARAWCDIKTDYVKSIKSASHCATSTLPKVARRLSALLWPTLIQIALFWCNCIRAACGRCAASDPCVPRCLDLEPMTCTRVTSSLPSPRLSWLLASRPTHRRRFVTAAKRSEERRVGKECA